MVVVAAVHEWLNVTKSLFLLESNKFGAGNALRNYVYFLCFVCYYDFTLIGFDHRF